MSLFEVSKIKKIYKTRFTESTVTALKDVNFTIEEGEFVAIMGESGSGKTTLLNILSLLDRPTEGSVVLDGKDLVTIKDSEVASFRRNNLGYVFQEYNLLDNFSVKDNILLPLVLASESYQSMVSKLDLVLDELGIKDLKEKMPYELSGGQKQRVAIARALITGPKIIFADEPTGALDSNSSETLLNYFRNINEKGQTILMVTHSTRAAANASRVLFIKDGVIFHQIYRANKSTEEFYEDIAKSLTQLSGGIKWNFTESLVWEE